MRSLTAMDESRLLLWLRVREFAVPPSMIERAAARRAAGDWAGACAAARVDVDLNLRALARSRGGEFAARVRDDLRRLAPDLLRWHMPRIAPDGLLRPGLTVSLARYARRAPGEVVHLVARTAPGWADAGQRISLTLWDRAAERACLHPRLRPSRRFRLDLHRHLWDVRQAGELRARSAASQRGPGGDLDPAGLASGSGYATDRWPAEAALLLWADEPAGHAVTVRLGGGRRLVLDLAAPPDGQAALRPAGSGRGCAHPMLPDAAVWRLPDLELLRAGLIRADQLHPLVAAALAPEHQPAGLPQPDPGEAPRLVECRGEQHRIGLVNGVLAALDHDPDEIRREELLAALGGPPLPCLRAIDRAHRSPDRIADVRARLDHGDAAGAISMVERLLGPEALLRNGALRDELETAAARRISHGLFRAGLAGVTSPPRVPDRRRRDIRSHPRHALSR